MLLSRNGSLSLYLCIYLPTFYYIYLYVQYIDIVYRTDITNKMSLQHLAFYAEWKKFFFCLYRGKLVRFMITPRTIKIPTSFAPDNSVIIHFTLWLSQFYSKERCATLCVVVAKAFTAHHHNSIPTYLVNTMQAR